jgi:hypothetical protein
MKDGKVPKLRESFHNNKIDLPFDEAVSRLLQAKPKARRKKATRKKKG